MNAHSKFRQTKKWKLFRLRMLKDRNFTCELCGTKRPKGKGFNVHHLCPSQYTLLTPHLFKVLCPSCHDLVERFAIKKDWGVYADMWHKLLDPFIPERCIK